MSNQIDQKSNIEDLSIDNIQKTCGQMSNVIEQVYRSALAQKRVSNSSGLSDVIIKLFDYFSYFNSLKPDDTVVTMQSIKTLDEIPVLNEFSGFISPTSVKMIAGNRRLPEIQKPILPTHVKVEDYSYYEYIQLIDKFRSYFKKDATTDIVSLASLKKEVSLMDVFSNICVVGSVNYDSDPFYPIFLNEWMEVLVGDSFLQDDAEVMIRDYCAKLRF